jgi:hypothetical protein
MASDGAPLLLLKEQFPELPCLELPSYDVKYPQSQSMTWAIIQQLPKIWRAVQAEKQLLNSWIDQYDFDAVISDNRFGMYSSRIPSVYITHQLSIAPEPPCPRWVGHYLHRPFLKNFDEVWLPDDAAPGISGWLGHSWQPARTRRIGVLSRFQRPHEGNKPSVEVQSAHGLQEQAQGLKIVVQLSGPEPQRSLLEQELIPLLGALHILGYRILLVRGLPGGSALENCDFASVPHLASDALQAELLSADLIVCRAGYSTLMDLARIHRGALLIPTPGQTEQEILAEHAQNHGFARFVRQGTLKIEDFRPVQGRFVESDGSQDALHGAITALLARCKTR